MRQLLNHTSGLAENGRLPEVHGRLGHRVIPAREQVRLADAQPRSFAPGAGWNYTNTGYLVAGLLIERLTGHELGQVLADRLFRPLHLTATSFEPQPGIPAGIAHGYWPGGHQRGRCHRKCRRRCLGRRCDRVHRRRRGPLYAALLSGRVLPAGLLAQMRTTVTPTQPGYGNGYGLGLMRFDLPCGPAWGHEGNLFSYTAMAFASSDGHRVAVVLVNGFTGPSGSLERVLMAMQHAVDVAYCHH